MNMGNKKARLVLISSIFSAVFSVVIHFLIINRKLPFLKNDTVFTGGKHVPTENVIDMLTPMFLYIAPVFVLVGVLNYIYYSKEK